MQPTKKTAAIQSTSPDEYRKYYGVLHSEESKVAVLMMLKERRDVQGDAEAGKMLLELGQKWLTERWIGK